MNNTSKKPLKSRVFLSYVGEDRQIAKKIANKLSISGFDIAFDERELLPGDLIADKLRMNIRTNDYVFILISKNALKKGWNESSKAYDYYLNELINRNVSLIPVQIDQSEIPKSLSHFRFLNLRKPTDNNITKLIEQIGIAPKIDFSSISSLQFEQLVADLLMKLNFKILQKEKVFCDYEIDLIAEHKQKDPFNVEKKEVWIVEIKLYRNERASLKSLYQLMSALKSFPTTTKALLVTNGLLTSYAKSWLNQAQKNNPEHLRIIEGPELKSLLLGFPEIIKKYFKDN
ncbi:MAG: TIR domain-containing protein [Candidatus Bathyarchaeota archaeon]|nr:MAG: TIR domain-containing protein [Candidatus Bathyarchaeota archaeon]